MADGKNIHIGHRKRAKEEFLVRGLEGLPDHKVLELVLFYAIPQGDVNPLAHELIERFGSLSGVMNATHEQLMAVKGVGENTATLLRLVPAVGGRYLQDRVSMKEIYTESWQFQELFTSCFFGAQNEMAYLVCLDAKRKLVACKKISEGDAVRTDVSMRKIVAEALACNAVYAVLAHNHLTGIALPSVEDRLTTKRLFRLLHEVDIRLLDHYIIVDGDMVSMRQSGYFEGIGER